MNKHICSSLGLKRRKHTHTHGIEVHVCMGWGGGKNNYERQTFRPLKSCGCCLPAKLAGQCYTVVYTPPPPPLDFTPPPPVQSVM